MVLGYFTEDAYYDLLNSIDTNLEKYSSTDEWLDTFFNKRGEYYKLSSVEVGNFTPSYTPGKKTDKQKAEEDLINTRSLYDTFKTLTPLQASNKYMWTYLCHANQKFYQYIIDRWMQEHRENTVKTRFFVTSTDNLLNDNALSRLWWYGHLTYDNESDDPYHLTKVLLTNETLCTDVMDTLNRTNFNRMKGVLLGIKDFMDVMDSNDNLTNIFRAYKKKLNHYSAVTMLDFLDENEIRNMVFEGMKKQSLELLK